MSLASSVADLATRIATELKTIRTEISSRILSLDIDEAVVVTAAEYAAITTPNPRTLYIEVG